VAIVGLPNVGKTTLFNALTGLEALTAAHPFSTTEPKLGVARVPDILLDEAAAVEGSAKTVHASLELLDLPAMAGPGGHGLAGKFIGRLREMEALAVVLRSFESELVPDDESGIDPITQAETLLLELALADADVFERKRERVAKEARADPSRRPEAAAIGTAVELLTEGIALRTREWSDQELAAFRDLAPITLKPAVWVVNVAEDEDGAAALGEAVRAIVPQGDTVVTVSAELEEEGARLDPDDRAEMFEGLGLGEGAMATMVRATYDALGLLSFYTLGPTEAHAWTVRRGATAKEAAGKIHSDLERGFIRAEVAHMPDVIAAGGWDPAKAAGAMRLEGKEYQVVEGDVLLIRFSV